MKEYSIPVILLISVPLMGTISILLITPFVSFVLFTSRFLLSWTILSFRLMKNVLNNSSYIFSSVAPLSFGFISRALWFLVTLSLFPLRLPFSEPT